MPAVTRTSEDPSGSREPLPTPETLLDIAIALNAAGWRATGFTTDGPCIIKGYHGSDPFTEIELSRHPISSAGHVGVALPPSLIILDVDHKSGTRPGWKHLEAAEAAYGPLPMTAMQGTPTGGAHLLFRLPPGVSETRLRAKVHLPDGMRTDIDILRPTNRYARVYDLDMWINLRVEDIPELPPEWLQGLVKTASGMKKAQIASPGSQHTPTFWELCDEIASQEEGHRNSTLFANAARAFTLGYTDPSCQESLRSAALRSGLSSDEVERTLESAWSRAENEWRPVGDWLREVEKGLEGMTKAKRRRLRSAALEVAARCLTHPGGTWVAISSRDMAEALGVSVQLAADCLTWLYECQLLRVRDGVGRFDAREYRIAQKLDTSSLFSSDPVSSFGASFGFSTIEGGRASVLLRHPAFQRMGGGLSHLPTLPGSAAEVLAHLEAGPMSARELADKTGYSRQTIGKTLKLLDSESLVDVRGKVILPLFEGSCTQSLDHWAAFHHLDSRPVERERRHRHQRFQYGQHQLVTKGVPLQGTRGRLVRQEAKCITRGRVRRDVVTVIDWRGPYPVLDRLELASSDTQRGHIGERMNSAPRSGGREVSRSPRG